MKIWKLTVTVGFIFNHILSFAQGRDNLWLYGGIISPIASMNFITGQPVISVSSNHMPIELANANITDTVGNLLFYTNGCYIANATGDTMLNGSDLNPGQCTDDYCSHGVPIAQADLILPAIGYEDIYYLFHETCYYLPNPYPPTPIILYYSVIDMAGDSGKGEVISKNNILISDTLMAGLVTAVKHANGRDWWIVVPKYHSNLYHILLLTPNGFIQNTTQQIGIIDTTVWPFQAVFSPDGSRYAKYSPHHDIDLMRFDRCSGIFYDYQHLQANDTCFSGGVAFSPNSEVLYVSSELYIYQFDLNAPNIQSSKTTVAVYDGFQSPPPFPTTFFMAQLFSDGKIYINTATSVDYIHVINYPDNIGVGCDVQQHSLFLQVENVRTIPNHPNYHLGAISGICDSLPTKIEFTNQEPIAVFPNPFGNKVFLKFNSNFKKIIQLFNPEGQLLFSENVQTSALDLNLSLLQQGIYILKIQDDNGYWSKKLIKFNQ